MTRGGKRVTYTRKGNEENSYIITTFLKSLTKKTLLKKNIFKKNVENYKWDLLSQISTLRKWKFPWACKSKIKFPWAWMLDGFFFFLFQRVC